MFGSTQYLRLAVTENLDEKQPGTFGVVLVSSRDAIWPIGRQDFPNAEEAERALSAALNALLAQNAVTA
jgi:hypothetical protein